MSSATKRILVVDDDSAVVDHLTESLRARGYDVKGTTDAGSVIEKLQNQDFDLVICDVEMPNVRGTDLLAGILELKPTQLVLLITAYGSVEMAVAALQNGACDFLTKPFKMEELVHAIERAFSERILKREVVRLRAALSSSDSDSPRTVVAKSPAMRSVLDLARRAAGSSSSVLITGETGSGKSMLAKFIHENGPRKGQPFVQLNCAAVPATLAESELFGVRRGAFTGAQGERQGLFMAAKGGTLFLDELGELPLEVQAKLLHVLETGMVRPLGGTKELRTTARFIAATNRSPEEMVRSGELRPDLYYRINVVRLRLPPLRERKEDIIALTDVLMGQAGEKNERPVVGISAQAMRRLVKYSWPGNVRELANVIERAVAMADHDVILPEDLEFLEMENPASEPPLGGDLSIEEMERAHVRRVVAAQGGNKAAAARILGITRRTLYRKLGADSEDG